MTASPDLDAQQRALLARHGFNPDLPPRGVGGPPGEFQGYAIQDGKPMPTMLRNHVCELEGVLIDGHEGSDLDPGSTACIHCEYEGPNL